MSETYNPDQWPEFVQRAVNSGDKICRFRDVSVRTDCLVPVGPTLGSGWFRGIKLPEIHGTNFLFVDEKGDWSHDLCAIAPDTVAVVISQPKPAEETIDTTFGELEPGDEFRYDRSCSGELMKFAKMVGPGEGRLFVAWMENSWGFLASAPRSETPIQKIVHKKE